MPSHISLRSKQQFQSGALLILLVGLLCQVGCRSTGDDQRDDTTVSIDKAKSNNTNVPLNSIKLPTGFEVDLFAENVPNARSMSLSPEGTLFIGNRKGGSVYALRDTNKDFKADIRYEILRDMNNPNGVAVRNGDLYVAEIDKIWVVRNIENNLADPPRPELVFDQYPGETHHGWKYIAFGPDGLLYVPVGAPCNICESDNEVFATMTRLDVDNPGAGFEIVTRGIRNSVGFDWHPVTNEFWFTDNGGDWLGDDMPACELNYAPQTGMHFGYPYCHQGDFPDPKLGSGKSCSDYTPPAIKLGPHVAPLGMEFYTGTMFPDEYQNQIFIAEHGSWNRSKPIGYRISLVRIEEQSRATSYETFAEGWLGENGKAWGRPVDVEVMPDGSLLVSDDYGGRIFRISYTGG